MTDRPDLPAFLRARFDEDAAVIEQPETWTAFDENESTGTRRVDVDYSIERVVACTRAWRGLHIARHDPGRVLREIDAKRRLLDDIVSGWEHDPGAIERHLRQHRGPSALVDPETGDEEMIREWTVTRQLRLLALPYADHPDYRDDWRP